MERISTFLQQIQLLLHVSNILHNDSDIWKGTNHL
jgi:hypothetical protein